MDALTDDQIRALRAGAWLALAVRDHDVPAAHRALALALACDTALGADPPAVRAMARFICSATMRAADVGARDD